MAAAEADSDAAPAAEPLLLVTLALAAPDVLACPETLALAGGLPLDLACNQYNVTTV